MEVIQGLADQLQFSLTASQIIISIGILALGAIWGRLKAGLFVSLVTIGYWGYSANESVLAQMAFANTFSIFMTLFLGLFMGFLLIYAWVLPSSK